jgi:hypothetical protein
MKLPILHKKCDDCREKRLQFDQDKKDEKGQCITIQKDKTRCEATIKHKDEKLCGRHYNWMMKNKSNVIKPTCVYIKTNKEVCGSVVKHEKEQMCTRHFKLLQKTKEKENEIQNNVHRCVSHYVCGGIKGKKTILPPNYPFKKCKACRDRARGIYPGSENVCVAKSCTNKIGDNEYKLCNAHYKIFVTEQEKLKHVVRCNSRTNCGLGTKEKAILPKNHKFKQCEFCRSKERKSDKERRDQKQQRIDDEYKTSDEKECHGCGNVYDKEKFMNIHNNECNNCSTCRAKNNEKDRQRDRRGRTTSDAVKETKKIWRQNNPEKMKEYNDRHRLSSKYINRNLTRNRILREYRRRNPEKFQIYNENRKKDSNYKLSYYKERAAKKKYDWGITDEYALELFSDECMYCGEFNEFGVNGIDRVDNTMGYIDGNVVPCCTVCNMIKCDMSEELFFNKVEHIMMFHEIIRGKLFTFEHTPEQSYNSKVTSAHDRNIFLSITNDEFDELSKKSCYICGKKSNEIHHNGIDRINNNKGYVTGNVAACCSTCNYMKGSMKLSDFMFKLYKIRNDEQHDDKMWVLIKINIHLICKLLESSSLTASNEQHPRRKIRSKKLDKLISDNSAVINNASLNVIICDLYKKLERKEITLETLIQNVEEYIERRRVSKDKKEKLKDTFTPEIEALCKPYKHINKFRKYMCLLKTKILNKEITHTNAKTEIKIYIKNKLTNGDKFELCPGTQVLIKKYKKFPKFVKFKNRYRTKAYENNISDEDQVRDITKYIKDNINI